jgi:ClpP class serine protease
VKVDALIKRLKPAEATSAHQGRIDAIQHALRENRAIPSFAETEDLIGASAVGKKLADEIGFAHRLVESVSETLSNDAYILTRYVVVLQQLDEAEQLLRKLAGSLSAEGASGRC